MEPLIKHRFWICSGLALIIVPVGWWIGTGNLKAQSDQRLGEIEAAFKGIPNGKGHPNEKWTKALQKVNTKRAEYSRKHATELRKMQKATQTWPAAVASSMASAKKFGDPGSNANALTFYIRGYDSYMREVFKCVDPVQFDPLTGKYLGGRVMFQFPNRKKATGQGSNIGVGGVPMAPAGPIADGGNGGSGMAGGQNASGTAVLPMVPVERWKGVDPSWDELWREQEKAWMLKMLLQAINRVNDRKNAKTIREASIRQINHIEIRGGSPPTEGGASGTATGGGEGGSTGDAAGTGSVPDYGKGGITGITPDGSGGRDAGAGGIGGGQGDKLPINSSDITDDLGTPRPLPKTGSEGEGSGQSGTTESTSDATGGAPAGPMGTASEGGAGSAYGGQQQGAEMSHYYENDPDKPYKKVGFVLKVLMKRKDIPVLIEELTDISKTAYPVKILRLHEASKNQDFKGENRTRSGGLSGPGDIGGSGGFGLPGGGDPAGGGFSRPGPPGGGTSDIGNGLGRGAPGIPGGPQEGFEQSGTQTPTNPAGAVQSALDDEGLGYVLVTGLITIYKTPQSTDAVAGAPVNPTGTGTPPQPEAKNGGQPAGQGQPQPKNDNTQKTPKKQTEGKGGVPTDGKPAKPQPAGKPTGRNPEADGKQVPAPGPPKT